MYEMLLYLVSAGTVVMSQTLLVQCDITHIPSAYQASTRTIYIYIYIYIYISLQRIYSSPCVMHISSNNMQAVEVIAHIALTSLLTRHTAFCAENTLLM